MYVPVDLDKTVHWDERALDALLSAEQHNSHRFADSRRMIEVQGHVNFSFYRSETAKWLAEV
jgi:hypothetical protein